MKKARYYIYRNLNGGETFSVKYRGIVIARLDTIHAINVEFKVSTAGRSRCLKNKERNVHAYAVAEKYRDNFVCFKGDTMKEVKYNPYVNDSFVYLNDQTVPVPVPKYARNVYFIGGKCYVKTN